MRASASVSALTTRTHCARAPALRTGLSLRGRPERRCGCSRSWLPDGERVLGPDHPDTLGTRNNIAGLTGETGKAAEALRLFQELLPDRERVLGRHHPDTLTTRNNIAALTGETGSAE